MVSELQEQLGNKKLTTAPPGCLFKGSEKYFTQLWTDQNQINEFQLHYILILIQEIQDAISRDNGRNNNVT